MKVSGSLMCIRLRQLEFQCRIFFKGLVVVVDITLMKPEDSSEGNCKETRIVASGLSSPPAIRV